MLRLTHVIWNIVYSLRASSPIWASEASRASTRELAAKQQGLRTCSRAGYYLFRYVFLNNHFVNRNCLWHNDVIDLTRNVGSLTWNRYPVLETFLLSLLQLPTIQTQRKGRFFAAGKLLLSTRYPVFCLLRMGSHAMILGPLCRLESFWFSATSGTVMLVISFLSLLYFTLFSHLRSFWLKVFTFYFYKRFDHVTSYDRPRYFETLNSFLFYLSLRLLRSKRFESSELLRAFPSPSPVIPFFFALVPATFSTNSRGNACYAG